jgi:nucleoside-diphosphate-sugar epimerase
VFNTYMNLPELKCAYLESDGIVVYGYNGFIGRKLQESIGRFKIVDSQDLRGVNTILHMATRPNLSSEDLRIQLEVDESILLLAKIHDAKLIYTSSNNVYKDGLCTTQDRMTPRDPYGASKCISEILYSTFYGEQTSILRIGDVFGRGQRHGNFFRSLEQKAIKHEPLTIFGHGTKTRSVIWIEDLVKILAQSLLDSNFLKNLTYNVAYVEPVSIKQIAELYDKYFKVESNFDFERQEDSSIRIMSIDHLLGGLDKPVKDALNSYFRSLNSHE